MICAVHAIVGAAVGRLAKRRDLAFAAGVATHLLGDLTPHKDLDPKTEAILLAGTMGVIAAKYGVTSPEFIGAFGGMAPDFENAAYVTGLLPVEKMKFPTHIHGGKYHGTAIPTVLPQVAIVALCLAFLFKKQ